MDFGTCPRCHLDIAPERRAFHPIVCNHCGFSSRQSEVKVQNQVETGFIKLAIGVSIFLSAAFVQVASWDSHFLTVIPLQVKQLIGTMSLQDHEDMAEMCFSRNKLDCVEKMYARTASTDLTKRARFADFLAKRDKVRLAAAQYKAYFDQGGVDLQVTYNYAKALSQLGQFEEASNLFQQVIDAKPETVQITVIQHLVRTLMNANQLEKAKSIIEDVRTKSAQANAFMAEEMAQILAKRS